MKETPKELIDNFTQTYTELIQDICCYSQQNLPLTIWVLGKDFKTVTNQILSSTEDKPNPFNNVVEHFTKDNAVAYVAGGIVIALAHTTDGKTTDKEIDSDVDGFSGFCGTTSPDGKRLNFDEVMKDPNKFNALIVVSSSIDASNVTAEMPTTTNDNLALYKVNKNNNDVTLTLNNGPPYKAVGDNTFVNILGERFGLRRKC